ncbi:MAG: molybdenum cofactor biosynthesis protein MoaE [Promethearchaeota archaeon]|nr:MAG: molybdenum cofactor biosynthesis protein MoaE [Candidatus Lokiarchaeota archaeon]
MFITSIWRLSKITIKSGIYEKEEIDFNTIITSIKNNPNIEDAGAILSFNGIVRNTSKDGKLVNSLTIDAYDELANKSIKKICQEIQEREGIIDIKIIHLKGTFQVSEDLVYVVVASAHREEGFEALRNGVERYKSEIEVWKRENFKNGSSKWIH